MSTAQSQLQANFDAATRDRERLQSLEIQIEEIVTARPAPSAPAPAVQATGEPAAPLDQQVELARAQLRAIELRYKEDHPDVRRGRRIVAELEAKAAAAAAEAAAKPDAPDAPAAAAAEPHPGLPPTLLTRLAALRLEANEIRAREQSRKAAETRLQQQLAGYVSRLESSPALESELTELMRDYEIVQSSYTQLLKKSEESKIAANLERRQIGEQFKVVDGARLPERPFSPDRQRLNLMGLAAGLGLGIAFVVLLEYRDTTLKTDVDVVTSLALPVLAAIPAMATAAEKKRATRRHLAFTGAASIAVLMAAAAFVGWKMRIIQDWIG
jgi:uncharacterized protein involved in exopolysaccharide biosynthesis